VPVADPGSGEAEVGPTPGEDPVDGGTPVEGGAADTP
jgi:hypothetical protein